MLFPLAYAQAADPDASQSMLILLLYCLGIIVATTLFAFVPIFVAGRRRHQHIHAMIAAMCLWGLILAGSAIYLTSAGMQWSKEKNLRLETGYGNPDDESGAPSVPVVIWIGLGLAYGLLIFWGASGKSRELLPGEVPRQ
jgi:MFS family permease